MGVCVAVAEFLGQCGALKLPTNMQVKPFYRASLEYAAPINTSSVEKCMGIIHSY